MLFHAEPIGDPAGMTKQFVVVDHRKTPHSIIAVCSTADDAILCARGLNLLFGS